jgi:hypothetical protein
VEFGVAIGLFGRRAPMFVRGQELLRFKGGHAALARRRDRPAGKYRR